MSIYKDSNDVLRCHVLGTRAAVSCFSVDLQYLSCARGGEREGEGISIHLGFREGMESRLHWPWTPPGGNSGVLIPMFCLQIAYYAYRLGSGCASAAGGRLYVLGDAAEY